MRALRYVRRVYSTSKWPWSRLSIGCASHFVSSTPIRFVGHPTPSSHTYDNSDCWDPFAAASVLQKDYASALKGTESVKVQHVSPTELSEAAPNVVASDVSVIDASGTKVHVTPIQYFSEITNTPDWLSKGIDEMGYPKVTPIQAYTIPILEKKHDLIGLAPTGSGKTVAFAVPALKHFKPSPDGLPTIIVLAPTRELVQQTAKVFSQLSSGVIRVCEAYGGAPREVQARRLHKGCDVLVACPGRLKDFLQNEDVTLAHMSFLVFDEADRLLDMGFKIQLDEILSYADPSRPTQTMMWSATWPKGVEELAREYLSQERYTIRAGTAGLGLQVNNNIRQHVLFADHPQERMEALVSLIQNGTIDENTAKMMIFVERQTDTENAAHLLAKMLGIHVRNVSILHGGMPQRQRDFVMSRFKHNQTRILVATDVASRGIDFPDVTCVVNFIAPKGIDSYCHRIGRTGRAGRTGDSFTFIGHADGSLARDLVGYLNKCGMEVPQRLLDLADKHTEYEESRSFKRSWKGRSGRGYNRPKREGRAMSQGTGW
ncbi:mitochondrial DEAD box protein [Trypanosoma conorhini]|uniref:RNA helicase n=1 Tax=Trypanosoma conorhini TaxID=83891 RepID=A0A422PSI4_9TRYP|nr:mitochondrial DEAD box protein [Trypanosoma conorhini]RNF20658.1 mitochondrial DEAD box protein [Trypanosoma conorhini]